MQFRARFVPASLPCPPRILYIAPMKSANRIHYAWVVLGVSVLVVTGALGLARLGYGVVLPEMQRSLGMDNTQAGALATANLVGYLLLSVTGGALAARFGPRRVITIGMLVVGGSMLMTATAGGFLTAALWRTLAGLGSGASNVPVMGLLSAWFGPRRRGFAAGIGVAGSSLALIVAGPLVPRLLAYFGNEGWRVAWCLFGVAGLVFALLALIFLRNRPGEMGLEPLGGSNPGNAETAVREPLQWGAVFRNPVVWHLGAIYTAYGFSYIIYMTFFKKCLMADAGYTPAQAGALFMLVGWTSLVCGLLWGSVSDHIGRRATIIIVYLIQTVAYTLFAAWPTPAGFLLSSILFGLTAWSIPAIMAAFCGDLLGPRLAPAGLGFVTLFLGIGQALGPAVAGAIADRAGGFTWAYALAAVVALTGAAGTAALHPHKVRVAQEAHLAPAKQAAALE